MGPNVLVQVHSVYFEFYSICVAVLSQSNGLVEYIARDFSHFRVSKDPHRKPDIHIQAVNACCDEPQPEVTAVMSTPRFAAYNHGSCRWVDYYRGQAVCRWDYASGEGTVWSADADLLYELTYLLLLSRLGENHDLLGLHRVHAAGLCSRGRAFLLLMPSGGGKTVLSLSCLEHPEISFLSDDSPLIERNGRVWAFPSRVGLCALPENVEGKHIRKFPRKQLGTKWLVDIEAITGRISHQAEPGALLIGVRKLGGTTKIVPMSKLRAFPTVVLGLVVGIGLPQISEFFLRFTLGDFFRKTGIAFSRLLAAAVLTARSRTYRLELGADLKASQEVVRDFVSGFGLAQETPQPLRPVEALR